MAGESLSQGQPGYHIKISKTNQTKRFSGRAPAFSTGSNTTKQNKYIFCFCSVLVLFLDLKLYETFTLGQSC